MNKNIEVEKINRFVNDKVMCESVYNILLNSFLKPQKNGDVQILAASRISIDLLNEAWTVLIKFQKKNEEESVSQENIGL